MRCTIVELVFVVAALAGPGLTLGLGGQSAVPGQVTPPRAGGPGATTAQGTAVIRGTVVAMDNGAPLGRVQIRAFGSTIDARGGRGTSTDGQGRFELRELPVGRYSVSATKAGFVSLQFGQRSPNARGTPIEVAEGQIVEKITIALPRGAIITGRISDDTGEPAAGVRVQVLRSMVTRGGRRPVPVGQDQTDDLGAFRIYGLPPGEYFVSAMFNHMGAVMTGALLATGDSDQGFAPTYYPGTPSLGEAQRVSVAVGQQVDGISFGLMPTRLSRISGRVIGWTAARGPGAVMAMPEEGMGTGPMMMPGTIQPEGDFEMRAVPPGRYVLRVQPRGPREAEELVGLTTVTVTGADLANVAISLQAPGTITGRIEFEGGTPPTARASQVRVMAEPADMRGLAMMMSGPPEVGDDFTFRVRGALGTVLLRVFGLPGWHVKSIVVDGEDIIDSPLPLQPGTNVQGARVLLTQAATTVSGSVRDDRGNAVVDATVLVFPDDDARWTFSSRFIRTTRPDTEGRFEFSALPPSNGYRIVALPSIEDGQSNDPEFLAGVRDRADRLSLAEGETKAMDLRLRP